MGTAIFYLAGASALGSAIAVVVQRNAFQAALALVLNLASLAALYLVLSADFVAAAQVLVYAGAVMIMFLFVIAYLGDRADAEARPGGASVAVALVAGFAIVIEVVIAVSQSSGILDTPATVGDQFGSPRVIGEVFLTDYLLAFEVVSLVLLVGAVAGVALGAVRTRTARYLPPRDEPAEAEPAEPEAPAVEVAP